MIQKHIEIVSSTIGSLSSMGNESRLGILAVLKRHYTQVDITIVNNLSDLEALVSRKPDLVFLGMKFIPSNPELGLEDPNKIWISRYLEQHGVAYTGSDYKAHNFELHKQLAKQQVLDSGLNTSPYIVVSPSMLRASTETSFSYPLFVKPTNRGGGLGIDSNSVVRNFEQLCTKVDEIAINLQSDALVEQYLPGREFSVAILKHERSNTYSVMPLELTAPADKDGVRILSEQIKNADTESSTSVIDAPTASRVTELAMAAFHALGARDYGRIDIRLDERDEPQFLEANLVPSLKKSPGNYFPKACLQNISLDYESMLLTIVRLAFARTQKVHHVVTKLRRPISPLMLPLQPSLNASIPTLLP